MGRPIFKVLEKLIKNNLIRPLPQRPPFPNADPKLYCKYHQTIEHDTDGCIHLKHEVQDLIDSGKITNPETRKPNTRNNPLPNYRNMPSPNSRIFMINTGLTEEQVLNFFINATPTILMPEPVTPITRTPEIKDLSLNQQPIELKVNVLDIWSSDNEREGRFDL